MGAPAKLKYHYFYRFFTYSVKRRAGRKLVFDLGKLMELHGEGGTSKTVITESGGSYPSGRSTVSPDSVITVFDVPPVMESV